MEAHSAARVRAEVVLFLLAVLMDKLAEAANELDMLLPEYYELTFLLTSPSIPKQRTSAGIYYFVKFGYNWLLSST